MAEDASYIVYVPKNEYEEIEEDEIALVHQNGEEEYTDAEYLDLSNKEDSDSNAEDDSTELLRDKEMSEPGPSDKDKGQPITFKWTHPATIHLIEAYRCYETELINNELSISQVWDEVAKELQCKAYDVTPLQCKDKFGSLKQIYEKTKEQEINSGVPVKKWIYLDLMEPIMTEMEKSYSNDSWDSLKRKDANQLNMNTDSQESVPKSDGNQTVPDIYKWKHPAILRLIDQYRKYQAALESGSISQKVLFKIIEKHMQTKGFNVTATQCMVKIHSLKKTYKSVKEYNAGNRLIPRRWRYYDLVDSIVNGTDAPNYDSLEDVSETLAEIEPDRIRPSHMFKWNRRSIEILVSAYREHRPPCHDTKATRHRVWDIVVQKLRQGGYNVSIAQCRSKISGMLKLYRKNKSGAVGRAWTARGGWYFKLIESLVEKPKRKVSRLPDTRDRMPESVLDQLIISEENRERRHRENMEQRQQLIDIMGQLLNRLS